MKPKLSGYDVSFKSQQAFTLIELMIALVLGLLISAAVLQIYLISTKTSVIQQSGSNIVDANVFGIAPVESRVKLTGLGLSDKATASANGSGIVLNAANNLKDVQLADGSAIDAALLTADATATAGTGNQWTGLSNTNTESNQLTIQYRAPQDTYDCEGRLALGPRTVDISGLPQLIDGQVIIERYFLRSYDGNIALACDAGRYITEVMDDYTQQGNSAKPSTVFTANNKLKDFGDAGEVLIANVDDFKIKLGVQATSGYLYVSPSQSTDTANSISSLPITAIKFGVITRGDNPLPGNETGQTSFNLLGETVTLNDGVPGNIIRRAYEGNIMLRNSRSL